MPAKRDSVNFTDGPILRQIIFFAVPLLLGQLFQQLYNSVDSIVVGRAVGTTALAAVSASSDISQLLIGFFTGLSTGFGGTSLIIAIGVALDTQRAIETQLVMRNYSGFLK